MYALSINLKMILEASTLEKTQQEAEKKTSGSHQTTLKHNTPMLL